MNMDQQPRLRGLWKFLGYLGFIRKKPKPTKHLLSLPTEILEIIVSHAIGTNGNLVHIKYNQADHMFHYALGDVPIGHSISGYDRNVLGPLPMPIFRHAICIADETEAAAYVEAKYESWNEPDTQVYEIERNATTRLRCASCGAATPSPVSEKLHLVLFACCRQLNRIANTVLYSQNTFSFDDALCFNQFLASLDLNQRKLITSLHLSRPLVGPSVRASNRLSWWKALEPSSIRALEGLRTIHLCLDMNLRPPSSRFASTGYNAMILEGDLEPFLQLRVLNLKTVTMIINDDVASLNSMTNERSILGRWTVTEKNKWAEKTRLKLLECYVDRENVTIMKRFKRACQWAGMTITKSFQRTGMTITKTCKEAFQRAG